MSFYTTKQRRRYGEEKRAQAQAFMSQPLPAGYDNYEYQIYLAQANDGNGGDITRGGAPLKTYDEWLNS